MTQGPLQTRRLDLVLPSAGEVLADIEAMSGVEREQVSDAWREQVRGAAQPDPWVHGFRIIHRATGGAARR